MSKSIIPYVDDHHEYSENTPLIQIPVMTHPVYCIFPQADGTCRVDLRSPDGWTELRWSGLTHEQAGRLADVLNEFRAYEEGYEAS